MKTITRSIHALLVALSLAAVMPACTGGHHHDHDHALPFPEDSEQVDAQVSLADARALAQRTLEALNDGSFAGFSERWDDEMLASGDEAAFVSLRTQVLADAGRFVAITDARVTEDEDEGVARFSFLCDFEKKELVYVLAFRDEGTEVAGVHLAPAAE